jgi:5-methylcytosine-specific restriction endonuclease McrA
MANPLRPNMLQVKPIETKPNTWEELERDLMVQHCSLKSYMDSTFRRYELGVIEIYENAIQRIENDILKIKDIVYLPEIIKYLKSDLLGKKYVFCNSDIYCVPYFNERISKYEKELADYEDEKRKMVEHEKCKSNEEELVKPCSKKSKKPSKKKIPAALKRLVWNKYIGETIGNAMCLCCNCTTINQLSFHCGHIISESNGGEMILSNLKPICQNCNSSMGTKNMDEFMLLFK